MKPMSLRIAERKMRKPPSRAERTMMQSWLSWTDQPAPGKRASCSMSSRVKVQMVQPEGALGVRVNRAASVRKAKNLPNWSDAGNSRTA
jgi:hypothetical protein